MDELLEEAYDTRPGEIPLSESREKSSSFQQRHTGTSHWNYIITGVYWRRFDCVTK
jgi:hypothetical protein